MLGLSLFCCIAMVSFIMLFLFMEELHLIQRQ